MRDRNLKPRQKLIDFRLTNLVVHPQARQSLAIWQRCSFRTSNINIEYLDKFYRPPLRLIEGDDSTLYFINNFSRVNEILASRSSDKYPCLVTPESIHDIQMLAWAEVVKLIFSKDINHPQLFKALKQMAPKSVICKLMDIDSLTIDNYCNFADITKTSFEYQQSKTSIEKSLIGLPMNMDWLVN